MCQFRIFVADTVASELDQVVATRKADVETVEASSPIVLDDINGDGQLDLVQVIWMQERVLVFAMQASTGMDLRRFPMELDGGYSRVSSSGSRWSSETVGRSTFRPIVR